MRRRPLYRRLTVAAGLFIAACRATDGDGSSVSMLEDSLHVVTGADSAAAAGEGVSIPDEPPPFVGADTGAPAAMLDDRLPERVGARGPQPAPERERRTPIPDEPRPGRP